MSQFEFNGLLDSALPNIYINRITLEQKNSQPLSNNPYDIAPHINETLPPAGKTGIPETSLIPTYGSHKDLLSVTFDCFLEIPNLDPDNFFSLDSLLTKLNINIFLFGPAAQTTYEFLISSAGAPLLANATAWPSGWLPGTHPSLQKRFDDDGLMSDVDYKHEIINGFELVMNKFLEGLNCSFEGECPNALETYAHLKDKYTKLLPDGTTVYKFPIRLKAEINGAFPSDLFALAFFSVDTDMLDLGNFGAGVEDAEIIPAGRITKEIIIQNGHIQDKGMIFFVSAHQSVPDDTQLSKAREVAFSHLKGQLWFGGVHKEGDRYAAGNSHITQMHPYLDYVIVPNSRIHDYRMINVLQKQLMSFNPMTNLVFGGDYIDFRSSTAAASLDNPAIFSDLLSSVDQDGAVKLFFSIDWGRLIKHYCAIPNLLDKASSFPQEIEAIFKTMKPISLKIFRERVDIPHSVVNEESNRKLIYDKYPQFYFFDQVGTKYQLDGTPLDTPILSSLVPVQLDPDKGSFNGKIKHYSLTDYEVPKTEKGKFRYSVEIEVADPTVPYLMSKYTLAKLALQQLKNYTYLAVGSADTPETPYYNKYLGEFDQTFKGIVDAKINFGTIWAGVNAFEFLTTITRSNWTKPEAEISVEDTPTQASLPNLQKLFESLIDINTVTPDSITAATNIFSTLTSQLKNIIEGFSTANIPKTDTHTFVKVEGEWKETAPPFTKMPIGSDLPQRIITANYTFDDPGDIVSTEQLDAGYDFFVDQKNEYAFSNGLKVISWPNYIQRSENEYKKYFIKDINDSLSDTFELAWDNLQYPFIIDSTTAKGRFFTISNFRKSIVLPRTVMKAEIWELGGAKTSWMIANNIIRYNFNLLGNPGPKNYLGYDPPGDLAVGISQTEITAEMERIIKEYQSLSFKGAIFGREHYRAREISSVKVDGDNPYKKDFTPPETGAITISGNKVWPQTTEDAIKMPWHKIMGQENLLLALIMQNYLKLGYWDIRLRSFSMQNSDSLLGIYMNNMVGDEEAWSDILEQNVISGIPFDQALATVLQPAVNALPNQIKVLMINNTHVGKPPPQIPGIPIGQLPAGIVGGLNEAVRYAAPVDPLDTLYSKTEGVSGAASPAKKNQTMFLNKFGEFWFKHQNIVEVEYLHSYLTTSKIPGSPPGRYEDTYNSSVKAPVWAPLTDAPFNSPNGGLLLCRFKKYKNPEILNQNVNNVLDLPLYDEYFFIKPEALQLPNQSITEQNKDQTITEPT